MIAPKAQHRPPPLPVPLARNVVATKTAKPSLTAKEALSAKARSAHQPTKAKQVSVPATTTVPEELVGATETTAIAAAVQSGNAIESLVDRWVAANNVEAIAAVADADQAPAAARKAARRGIAVLKARGIAVPERQRVARLIDDTPTHVEATFLPPDGSGASAFTIAKREANGRFHIAEVIIRDAVGVLYAGSGWLSGSQLKDTRARAEKSVGVAPVRIPIEWARERIARAVEQNKTSGRVLPLQFDSCRPLVESKAEAATAHPLADLEASAANAPTDAHVTDSARVHEEPEFHGWIPDQAAVGELLQKVGERLGSDGMKDPARFDEALREEVAAATDRYFTPDVRSQIAARLLDAAISVRARRGDERATALAVLARAIREAGLITSPPRDIPFLLGYFQKAIGMLARQNGGQLRIPVRAG